MSAKESHMICDLRRTGARLEGGWIVELPNGLRARWCAPEPEDHELAARVGIEDPYNVVLSECAADQT